MSDKNKCASCGGKKCSECKECKKCGSCNCN